MAGLAGKNMRFDMGAGPTHMRVVTCRSKLETQLLETTNAESVDGSGNSNDEFVFGVKSGDVDIDVVYDEADTPYATIGDGVSGTATFYPDKAQTTKKLTGTLMIGTFELLGEIKGLTKARVTGKFSGGRTVTSL